MYGESDSFFNVKEVLKVKFEISDRLLLKLKKDHTIVMISHDKNVLKDAEKIIVMDAKQVAESGTLSELIEKKGTYYNLFEKSSVSSKEE